MRRTMQHIHRCSGIVRACARQAPELASNRHGSLARACSTLQTHQSRDPADPIWVTPRFMQVANARDVFIAKDKQLFRMAVDFTFKQQHADPELMHTISVTCHEQEQYDLLMRKFREARAAGFSMRIFEAQMLLWCCNNFGTIDDALYIFQALQVGPGDVIAAAPAAVLPLLVRQCHTVDELLRVYNAMELKTFTSVTEAPNVLTRLLGWCIEHRRTDLATSLLHTAAGKYSDADSWRQLGGWFRKHYLEAAVALAMEYRGIAGEKRSAAKSLLKELLRPSEARRLASIRSDSHALVDASGVLRPHLFDILAVYRRINNIEGITDGLFDEMHAAYADIRATLQSNSHNEVLSVLIHTSDILRKSQCPASVWDSWCTLWAHACSSNTTTPSVSDLVALLHAYCDGVAMPSSAHQSRTLVAGLMSLLQKAQSESSELYPHVESATLRVLRWISASSRAVVESDVYADLARCVAQLVARNPSVRDLASEFAKVHRNSMPAVYNPFMRFRKIDMPNPKASISKSPLNYVFPLTTEDTDESRARRIEIFDTTVLDGTQDVDLVLECRERLRFPDAAHLPGAITSAAVNTVVDVRNTDANQWLDMDGAVYRLAEMRQWPEGFWDGVSDISQTARNSPVYAAVATAAMADACNILPIGGDVYASAAATYFRSLKDATLLSVLQWSTNTPIMRYCAITVLDSYLSHDVQVSDNTLESLVGCAVALVSSKDEKMVGAPLFSSSIAVTDINSTKLLRALLLNCRIDSSISIPVILSCDISNGRMKAVKLSDVMGFEYQKSSQAPSAHNDAHVKLQHALLREVCAIGQSDVAFRLYLTMQGGDIPDGLLVALVNCLCDNLSVFEAMHVVNTHSEHKLVNQMRIRVAKALCDFAIVCNEASQSLFERLKSQLIDTSLQRDAMLEVLQKYASACIPAFFASQDDRHGRNVRFPVVNGAVADVTPSQMTLTALIDSRNNSIHFDENHELVETPQFNGKASYLLTHPFSVLLSSPLTAFGRHRNSNDTRGLMRAMALACSDTGLYIAKQLSQHAIADASSPASCIKSVIGLKTTFETLASKSHQLATSVMTANGSLDASHAEVASLLFRHSVAAGDWGRAVSVVSDYTQACRNKQQTPHQATVEAFIIEFANAVKPSHTTSRAWMSASASTKELEVLAQQLADRLNAEEVASPQRSAQIQDRLKQVNAAAKITAALASPQQQPAPGNSVITVSAKDFCLSVRQLGVLLSTPEGDVSPAFASASLAGLKYLVSMGYRPTQPAVNAVLAALDRRMRYDKMTIVFQELRECGILPL